MPVLSRILPRFRELSPVEGAEEELLPPAPGSSIEAGRAWLNAPLRSRLGLFENCSNPHCNSGWMHLLRSRTTPVFEGGWNCSPECTRIRLQAAVRREMDGRGVSQESHRHRIPLGLMMLEQGWINAVQLKTALEAQRSAGGGRLGNWLVRRAGVSEQMVTRALGLQWSCPVLPLEYHDAEAMSVILPRLFVDAFGALPLRVAAGKLLYLGFEDRQDPMLALALSRMSGLRVENGLVQSSLFHNAHERMLRTRFPSVELIEATSEPAIVHVLSRAIEKHKPAEARLVRVHDCLWLRLWKKSQVGPLPDPGDLQDLICSIGSH